MDKYCFIPNVEKFKKELSDEIYEKLKEIQPKKWLRSKQVCDMLGISPSVLQQLRINGDFSAVKLSTGTWLYSYQGIVDALESKTIGGKEVNHD